MSGAAAGHAIEYFATLGRKKLVCKSFQCSSSNGGCGSSGSSSSSSQHQKNPAFIWNEAITDIVIIHAGETIPEEMRDWEMVQASVDNSPTGLTSMIAFQRRSASQRLDHITKIKVVRKGDVRPAGFEIIETSATSAFPGEIEGLGTLAIKRAKISAEEFIQGEPLVDDICFVLTEDGEEVPEGYVSLDREISSEKDNAPGGGKWTSGAVNNRAARSNSTSGKVILAYHQRPSMGLCDLRYESCTLDRYPQKDHTDFPLPVFELPLFAFPHDLRLSYSSTIRFPLPVFFTFVFTDAKGVHMYAACLRFYEIVPHHELESIIHQVYGPKRTLEMVPGNAVFCPKIICVVSRMPFYRAMRRYLCQVFSMSLSSLPCPLEFFIASVVGQVPLPVAGGRPFHVVQDAALISSSSSTMNPIEFEVPLPRFFPPMDLDFAAPLRCLSVDRLLAVFTLMLREAKLVFLCSSNTLLTESMETLRSLLFPLKWSSTFVSRLPDELSGLLEAPGGFMIGLHMMEDSENDVEVVESQWNRRFGDRKAVQQVQWTHSLQPGTIIVDLSNNEIFQYGTTNENNAVGATWITNIVNSLPPGPRKRLQKKLQRIATAFNLGPQTTGLDKFDSAFEFQTLDESPSHSTSDFPTLELRDAFMVFMADVLGNYPKYIIPPLEDMSADPYRTFKEGFSVDDYLSDAGALTRPVLESLTETQMFAVLLQQRSEASDYSLVFFESAAELLREYKLTAGGHGTKSSSVTNTFSSTGSVPEMYAPLYKLLAAKSYATANGRVVLRQGQSHLSGSRSGSRTDLTQLHAPPPPPPPPAAPESAPHVEDTDMFRHGRSFFSSLRSSTNHHTTSPAPIATASNTNPATVTSVGQKRFSLSPKVTKEKKPRPPKNTSGGPDLEILLDALDELEVEEAKRTIQVELDSVSFGHGLGGSAGGSGKRRLTGARNELDLQPHLRLHNRALGPLIIPGPSRTLVASGPTSLQQARLSMTSRSSLISLSGRTRAATLDSIDTSVCDTDAGDSDDDEDNDLATILRDRTHVSADEINYLRAVLALHSAMKNPDAFECDYEYDSDLERDSEGRFTYQSGWPVLNARLLRQARKSVHGRLAGLRKSRLFSLKKVNRDIYMFIRAPSEQWGCYRNIALATERAFDEQPMSLPPTASGMSTSTQGIFFGLLSANQDASSLNQEAQLVTRAAADIMTISIMMLCTRTLHDVKPVADMLQVLGILAQADQLGLSSKFDECVWRTMLVSCAHSGGDVMRKSACVIFDSFRHHGAGITPDALTYGSYTRALSATRSRKPWGSSPIGDQLDPFLYLEEMGKSWFLHRCALIENAQSNAIAAAAAHDAHHGSAKKTGNTSSGMISALFSKRSSGTAITIDPRKRTAGGVLSPTTDITTTNTSGAMTGSSGPVLGVGGGVISESAQAMLATAAQLGLKPRSSLATAHGALSLMRPPGPFLLCPPRYTVTFPTNETLSGTSDTVIDLAAEISAHLSKLVIERKCPSPTPVTYATPTVKASTGGPAGKDGSDRSATPESSLRGGTPLSIGKEAIRDLFGTRARSPSLQSDEDEDEVDADHPHRHGLSGKYSAAAATAMMDAAASSKESLKNIGTKVYGSIKNTSQNKLKVPTSAAMKESVKGSLIDLKSSAQAATSSLRRISVNMHYPFSKDSHRPSSSATDNILHDDDVWAANISDEEEGENKDNRDGSCASSSSMGIGATVVVSQQCVMAVSPPASEATSPNQRHRTSSIKSIHFSDDEDSSDEDDEVGSVSVTGAQAHVGSSPTRRRRLSEGDNTTAQPQSHTSDANGVVEEEMDSSQRTWRSRTSQDPNAVSDEQPSVTVASRVVDTITDRISVDVPNKGSTNDHFGPFNNSNGDKEIDRPVGGSSSSVIPVNVGTRSHNPPTDPITPTRYVRTNTLAMQSDLSQAFARATQKGRAMAAIHSMSPCPQCGHTLMDEEVMAMWSGQESTVSPTWAKIHRKPSEATPQSSINGSLRYSDMATEEGQDNAAANYEAGEFSCPVATVSDMRGSDIEAAHRLTCPVCAQRITPQLHIRCYEISDSPHQPHPNSHPPNNPSSSSATASTQPTTATTQEPPLSSEIQTALSQHDGDDFDSDNNDGHSASQLTPPRAAAALDEDGGLLSPDGPYSPCSSVATGARTAHRQHHGSTTGQDSSSQAGQSPDVTQRIAPTSSTAASISPTPPPAFTIFWSEDVPHLSPSGLRLALEELMERIGERVVDGCWLHVHGPAVYWNIIWYCSRLKVPSGFLASSSTQLGIDGVGMTASSTPTDPDLVTPLSTPRFNNHKTISSNLSHNLDNIRRNRHCRAPNIWHLPAIIGWRETAVRAKVLHTLTPGRTTMFGSDEADVAALDWHPAENLQLSDLFPESQESYVAEVQRKLEALPFVDRAEETAAPSAFSAFRRPSGPLGSSILPSALVFPSVASLAGNASGKAAGNVVVVPPIVTLGLPSGKGIPPPPSVPEQDNVLPPPTIPPPPPPPPPPPLPANYRLPAASLTLATSVITGQHLSTSLTSPSAESASTPTHLHTGTPGHPPRINRRLPGEILERAADYLDGSSDGMRRAIVEVGKYRRIVERLKRGDLTCLRERDGFNEDDGSGSRSLSSDGTLSSSSVGGSPSPAAGTSTWGRGGITAGGDKKTQRYLRTLGSRVNNHNTSGKHGVPVPTVVRGINNNTSGGPSMENKIRTSQAIARDIYVDLLTLTYFFKSARETNTTTTASWGVGGSGGGSSDDLHRGTQPHTPGKGPIPPPPPPPPSHPPPPNSDPFREALFEKLFVQVVWEVLSYAELDALGTTEEDLVGCVEGRAAQAFRIGLGWLF